LALPLPLPGGDSNEFLTGAIFKKEIFMQSERYLSPRILFAVLLGLIGGTSAFGSTLKDRRL